MALTFRKLHPTFVGEARGVELRSRSPIRACWPRSVPAWTSTRILVFRDQTFTDQEQLAFAGGSTACCTPRPAQRVLGKNRFGNEALTDISNLDEKGEILQSEDRRRMYGLGNRLWHTDASFQDPPGRYSMLSAG